MRGLRKFEALRETVDALYAEFIDEVKSTISEGTEENELEKKEIVGELFDALQKESTGSKIFDKISGKYLTVVGNDEINPDIALLNLNLTLPEDSSASGTSKAYRKHYHEFKIEDFGNANIVPEAIHQCFVGVSQRVNHFSVKVSFLEKTLKRILHTKRAAKDGVDWKAYQESLVAYGRELVAPGIEKNESILIERALTELKKRHAERLTRWGGSFSRGVLDAMFSAVVRKKAQTSSEKVDELVQNYLNPLKGLTHTHSKVETATQLFNQIQAEISQAQSAIKALEKQKSVKGLNFGKLRRIDDDLTKVRSDLDKAIFVHLAAAYNTVDEASLNTAFKGHLQSALLGYYWDYVDRTEARVGSFLRSSVEPFVPAERRVAEGASVYEASKSIVVPKRSPANAVANAAVPVPTTKFHRVDNGEGVGLDVNAYKVEGKDDGKGDDKDTYNPFL